MVEVRFAFEKWMGFMINSAAGSFEKIIRLWLRGFWKSIKSLIQKKFAVR